MRGPKQAAAPTPMNRWSTVIAPTEDAWPVHIEVHTAVHEAEHRPALIEPPPLVTMVSLQSRSRP